MKRIISIVLFIGLAVSAWAGEVTFTAKAPKQVVVGKPFQVSFSVNEQGRDLRAPQFVDFDVLSGPYTSTSSSTSYVNGQRSSTFEQTYTYTLRANKAGTFTIGPATIKVSGKDYQSNGVRVQVLPEDETPQSSPAGTQTSQSTSSSQNSSEEMFVRTIVSKTKVHEQEAILLTYRLYFANIDGLQVTNNNKLPEFSGFLKQDIEQKEIQSELEHYNGKNYQVADLLKYVLFPQRTGDLVIEPAQFEFLKQVRVRQRVRSIFDDYFDSYTTVPQAVKAPSVTIHVDALPAGKPTGFSGVVGNFTLSSSITKKEMQLNEGVTLKVTISGEGNMKMLKTPTVDWPAAFEAYEPQVSNNYNITSSGYKGSKTVEFPLIARNSGEYTIPAVTFSYFDTREKQYKTLRTEEYTIRVNSTHTGVTEQATPTAVVVNYVQTGTPVATPAHDAPIRTDIRPIDISDNWQKKRSKSLIEYGSVEFWLCYLLPLGVALILLIILRKRIQENADLTRVRYKHANKVAQKRLKAARAALKENDKDLFYAAIEKAAWTYLSDRLSIPTAELNKDNITSILQQKGVQETLISEVAQVLDTAAFARYAPTTDHAMEDLYRDTTKLIDQLEEQKL